MPSVTTIVNRPLNITTHLCVTLLNIVDITTAVVTYLAISISQLPKIFLIFTNILIKILYYTIFSCFFIPFMGININHSAFSVQSLFLLPSPGTLFFVLYGLVFFFYF